MSKRNPLYQVRLSCGHWAYWQKHALSELRTCSHCGDVVQVAESYPRQWVARCHYCLFARMVGQDYHAANQVRHRHPTIVIYEIVEPSLREPLHPAGADDMLSLFDVDDRDTAVPPF